LSVLFVASAAGCARSVPPRTELEQAERSLRDAHAVGAGEDVTASLYLALAEQEMSGARAAMANGQMDEARGLAIRGRADADMAVLVAREAGVRAAALQTMDEADRLAGQLR